MNNYQMKSEVVTLTPQMAQSLIEINTSNRTIRPSHVRSIAEAMRRGEWMLSPQGISISNEGVVLDGQHRLKGVIASGISVPMIIWRDVDPATFPILDRGVGRTLSDATKLPTRHVGILSFFHYFSCGSVRKATPQEIEQINDIYGQTISDLLVFAPSMVKGVSQVGVMAAAVFMAEKGEKKWSFDIYRRLTLGSMEGLPSSALAMVKQLLRGGLTKGRGGESQIEAFTKGLVVFSEKSKDRQLLTYTNILRDEAREMVAKRLTCK